MSSHEQPPNPAGSALVGRPDRTLEPGPNPGLSLRDFRPIATAGFGDPYNAYPHSMAWFNGCLYVGTTRSNMCMLKASKAVKTNLAHWPVECPEYLYDLDMRAQIWRYDPLLDTWTLLFRAPTIEGIDGTPVPREMGYRCMAVFQGENDESPALYLSTYAPAKAQGTQILRTIDGSNFALVSKPQEWDRSITSLRLLVPFKGRLFAAPTGRAYTNPNASVAAVFETRDPAAGEWRVACRPGFGDARNVGIFEMHGMGDHLYAGTGSMHGYQIWRTKALGNPPYEWEMVVENGAYRGKNNQGVASFCAFKDALYVGGGIQNGGIDIANKVGPAAPELIRIHTDGTWDLIVGHARDTPVGRKEPLSGYAPGFNNPFNGYFWRLGHHDGWLYQGTYDWSILLSFSRQDNWPPLLRNIVRRIGFDAITAHLGGADLYQSYDGENWVPVTTDGFHNAYNFGIRNLVSTPFGLAVGVCNPFGPRVACHGLRGWYYADNPRGGAEVWLGSNSRR